MASCRVSVFIQSRSGVGKAKLRHVSPLLEGKASGKNGDFRSLLSATPAGSREGTRADGFVTDSSVPIIDKFWDETCSTTDFGVVRHKNMLWNKRKHGRIGGDGLHCAVRMSGFQGGFY